jgi:hypothetical protein
MMALLHRTVRSDIDIISVAVILSQLQRIGTIVAKSLSGRGQTKDRISVHSAVERAKPDYRSGDKALSLSP